MLRGPVVFITRRSAAPRQPSAETTGVPSGQVLTRYPQAGTGDYLAATPGAVIDGLDVHGWIIVTAPNVTIRNCRVRGRVGAVAPAALVDVRSAAAKNALIERCTLVPDPAVVNEWANGIDGHTFTARANNIYNVNDGIRVRGAAVIMENFIHDFAYVTPVPTQPDNQSHNDGVQLIGARGARIQGNNIQCYYGTAGTHQPPITSTNTPAGYSSVALTPIMFNVSGSVQSANIAVEDNWLIGGWTAINSGDVGQAGAHLGSILRNRFSRDAPRAPRVIVGQTVDLGNGSLNTNRWADDLTPAAITRVSS